MEKQKFANAFYLLQLLLHDKLGIFGFRVTFQEEPEIHFTAQLNLTLKLLSIQLSKVSVLLHRMFIFMLVSDKGAHGRTGKTPQRTAETWNRISDLRIVKPTQDGRKTEDLKGIARGPRIFSQKRLAAWPQ